MLNIIAIMGRLVADPELRQTSTGKNVASFRIGCDRNRKDANGQSQTDWFDMVAWDKTADFICRYFQKGSMIAIDGRLQSRRYQDKNGYDRTAIEIVVNNAHFCGSKKQDDGERYRGGGYNGAPAQQNANVGSAAGNQDDFELLDESEDLPF